MLTIVGLANLRTVDSEGRKHGKNLLYRPRKVIEIQYCGRYGRCGHRYTLSFNRLEGKALSAAKALRIARHPDRS
jgi:hypothetical protein